MILPAVCRMLIVGGMGRRIRSPGVGLPAGRRSGLGGLACDIAFIVAGAPLSAVAPACVALCPILLRHKLRAEIFAGHAPLAITVAAVVPAVLLVAAIPVLTAAQRWRFASFAGVTLDRPDPPSRLGQARDLRAWLGREATWRQLTYHLIVGPVLAAAGLLALGMLGVGLALCLVFFWIPAVRGTHPLQVQVTLTVAGFALLGAAPWTLRRVFRADTRIGGDLLGPSRAERQLASIGESRSGLVAAADAERRRIERDLHDGAQARLVSLAMNLGLARATRTGISPDAMAIIAEAQDETIKAIDELRHLVRGLHPAVLDDRGLDAALSALAARLPVPVNLHVTVPERASPAVEAVAYFVVSEALTNIARHVGVLLLSQYVEEHYATELLSSGTNGVGYLLKQRVANVGEFAESVRRVAAGGTALDPDVVSQLLLRRAETPVDRLTSREREVLGLMAEGRSNPAIAHRLVVTESAVAKHINNIFTKLDLPPADNDHRRVLAVLHFLGHSKP